MGKFYSDTIKIPKPPYECVSADRPSALIFLHKKSISWKYWPRILSQEEMKYLVVPAITRSL